MLYKYPINKIESEHYVKNSCYLFPNILNRKKSIMILKIRFHSGCTLKFQPLPKEIIPNQNYYYN